MSDELQHALVVLALSVAAVLERRRARGLEREIRRQNAITRAEQRPRQVNGI